MTAAAADGETPGFPQRAPKNTITTVYVDKQGNRVTKYHRTPTGTLSWEHPYGDGRGCPACEPTEGKP